MAFSCFHTLDIDFKFGNEVHAKNENFTSELLISYQPPALVVVTYVILCSVVQYFVLLFQLLLDALDGFDLVFPDKLALVLESDRC